MDAASGMPGGPWRIRVRPKLVYSTPSVGTWWWGLTITGASGEIGRLLVGPRDQTPESVREVVAKALRGELLPAACPGFEGEARATRDG